MSKNFISNQLYAKIDTVLEDLNVSIEKPNLFEDDGYYYCKIEFDRAPQFDNIIKGLDEFDVISRAILYFRRICECSEQPELFSKDGESLLKRES